MLPTSYFVDEKAGITLYHGDCLQILPLLGGVDCVLTDPPYSRHTHEKQRHGVPSKSPPPTVRNGKVVARRADISRHADLGFEHLSAKTRLACAAEFARLAHRWVLVFSDLESTGLWRRSLTGKVLGAGVDERRNWLEYVRTGLWVKLASTPQFTGDRPANAAEAITICHATANSRHLKKQWNGGGGPNVWSHAIVQNRSGRGGGVQQGGEGRWHTAQKPLALMHDLVRLFTDPGEVVLDPFAGSGTTLLACKNLGRKAIGVEVDEESCRKTVERLRQQVLLA